MPNALMLYWRTFGGTLGGLVATWLATHHVTLPDSAKEYLTGLLIGAGVTVYVALSHWLQTRTGNKLWARAARWIGRAMVAGAGAVPDYKVAPR